MRDFVYVGRPARVVFGFDTAARVRDEAVALGIRRALVLCTPTREGDARRLAESLGDRAAGVFAGATMHTPIAVTERALEYAREHEADGVVAFGGGSTTGLGKAMALRTDFAQVVVPTTYAGSEMTDIVGETAAGEKKTQRSPRVLPEAVVYDVALTLNLPVHVSVTSGVNAIAHAVEALYASDTNPAIALLAQEGIAAMHRGVDGIFSAPADRQSRWDALYAAWLCGTCLGSVTMGLHHKLCHTLGGMFNLPHADMHTVLLPYAMAYNAANAPAAMARVAQALGVADAVRGLRAAIARWGGPRSLRELGMPEVGIDPAATAAARNPYANPRPVEREGVRRLLVDAWAGAEPAA